MPGAAVTINLLASLFPASTSTGPAPPSAFRKLITQHYLSRILDVRV